VWTFCQMAFYTSQVYEAVTLSNFVKSCVNIPCLPQFSMSKWERQHVFIDLSTTQPSSHPNRLYSVNLFNIRYMPKFITISGMRSTVTWLQNKSGKAKIVHGVL
jgi:hypothetical protein